MDKWFRLSMRTVSYWFILVAGLSLNDPQRAIVFALLAIFWQFESRE